MADAPSSGGGSGWGAFEVVLALILAIGLLSNLNGNKNKTVLNVTPPKTTISPIDTSANRCGLSITSPLSLEKVSNSVRISGSVNGCNWNPSGNTALFAQVITGGGVPVSDFITVTNNGANFLNTSFDTTIAINGNPNPGTGYLILIPATQTTEKQITVRIPVRFVRN